MGSSSSKFRRYLQNGDEYAALQVFQNSMELQHSLDPNSSYGDTSKHNTSLHLVAKHAMKPLLRIFLYELKGNPNKPNASGETALHLVCQGDLTRSIINQERRALCLSLLLQWSSVVNGDKIKLDALDKEGNTALHYAAASGLMRCVEMLVASGAPLFIENKSSETVCDLAEKNKHEKIAQFFEAKMLFCPEDNSTIESEVVSENDEDEEEEVLSGLRAQDLQEAKDQLLVETSDMLHVPLFTAEVLLRNYEWSRQSLWEAWMKDPIACCQKVGITPPSSAVNFSATRESLKACCEQIQQEYQNETLATPVCTVIAKAECGICIKDMSSEEIMQVPCLHQFCKDCWQSYLTAKIKDGETQKILCPAFKCEFVVPVDIIEKLVSSETVKKYLQFDIKAFVESNPSMKWFHILAVPEP